MFRKLVATTLLATAVLGSGSIANATSPSISDNVSPLANNLSTLATNSNGQFTTLASSVYYLAETRLEGKGSKYNYYNYYKSYKFTIKNSTGTTYKGWQRSERNDEIAHVSYNLIDPSTGDTVTSVQTYGNVKKDDWFEFKFSNVSTTKDYQLEVQNLGKYPVKLSGNVYN
ncbi:hypothetical protein ACN6A9_01935 [Bacillus safensis]